MHGGLKLGTNNYKGSVSEATNNDLRLKMEPVMASGLESGRSIGDRGVRVSMIVLEVEAVGGFAGTSFSAPILNAGVLLSVFGCMLYVQPWMAAIALVMFLPPRHSNIAGSNQSAHRAANPDASRTQLGHPPRGSSRSRLRNHAGVGFDEESRSYMC